MPARASDTFVFLMRHKSYHLLTYLLVNINTHTKKQTNTERKRRWSERMRAATVVTSYTRRPNFRQVKMVNNTSSQKEQSTKYQCRVCASMTSAQVTKFMIVGLKRSHTAEPTTLTIPTVESTSVAFDNNQVTRLLHPTMLRRCCLASAHQIIFTLYQKDASPSSWIQSGFPHT